MTQEQDNTEVKEEVVPVEHPEEHEVIPEGEEASQEEETPEQINWKKVREQQKIDRERQEQKEKEAQEEKRRRAEAEAQAEIFKAALQSAQFDKGAPLSDAEQNQIIADIEDDDIPMGRDIKGFVAKYVADTIKNERTKWEKEVQQQQQEKEKQEVPDRLRRTYNDFDDLMTKDNFDYLTYQHPEIAQALGYMPEGYDKWSNTYKMIKKLVPNAVGSSEERRRVEENRVKPQSVPGATGQPAGDVAPGRRLTQAQKQANYERLRALARGI